MKSMWVEEKGTMQLLRENEKKRREKWEKDTSEGEVGGQDEEKIAGYNTSQRGRDKSRRE